MVLTHFAQRATCKDIVSWLYCTEHILGFTYTYIPIFCFISDSFSVMHEFIHILYLLSHFYLTALLLIVKPQSPSLLNYCWIFDTMAIQHENLHFSCLLNFSYIGMISQYMIGFKLIWLICLTPLQWWHFPEQKTNLT